MHVDFPIFAMAFGLLLFYFAFFFGTFKKATNHVRSILLMGVVLNSLVLIYFLSDYHVLDGLTNSQSLLAILVFDWIFHLAVLKLILDNYRCKTACTVHTKSVRGHLNDFIKESETGPSETRTNL